MVLIRAQTAITFRQTAYFCSTQLLLFVFARQRIGGDKLLLINPFNAELLGTLASPQLNSWGGGGGGVEKNKNIL